MRTAAARPHDRDHGAAQAHRRHQLEIDVGLPAASSISSRPPPRGPAIVEQDILDAAECVGCRVHEAPGSRPPASRPRPPRAPPRRFAPAAHGTRPRDAPRRAVGDAGTSAASLAAAARRRRLAAGDQRDFLLKVEFEHVSLPDANAKPAARRAATPARSLRQLRGADPPSPWVGSARRIPRTRRTCSDARMRDPIVAPLPVVLLPPQRMERPPPPEAPLRCRARQTD